MDSIKKILAFGLTLSTAAFGMTMMTSCVNHGQYQTQSQQPQYVPAPAPAPTPPPQPKPAPKPTPAPKPKPKPTLKTIYTATWCAPCKALKKRLADRGIVKGKDYKEVDVDEAILAEDTKAAIFKHGIPLIRLSDDSLISGANY